MKKRLLACMQFAIMLLCSLMWAAPAFARQTLELSFSREVTAKQLEDLASYGLRPGQLGDFQRLVSMAIGQVEATFDRRQKIPSFVKAEILFPPGITQPEEQGYYFFEQFRGLYRIRDLRRELRPTKVWKGRLQNINIRYEQYYEGIRVVGAEMLVHVKSDGRLWFVQGIYVPDINISTVPAIERTEVFRIVENDFVVRRGPDVEFKIAPPELGILNPWVYDRSLESKNLLIWVAIATENLTGRAWTYYVDARDGGVLKILDSARQIASQIWDNQNTAPTIDDVQWYQNDSLITNPPPQGTLDPETTDLNNIVTDYWEYLADRFHVYSINSASAPDGMNLIAHAYWAGDATHPCPQAACWNCITNQATFCQGMVQRDIVCHELTHGLVQHTGGGLAGTNQPGALDESFADVFGEFVDCWRGNCTWIIGPLRDLSNPLNPVTNRPNATNHGQSPDHIGNTNNAATDHPLYIAPGGPDFGGIHYNNGIPNIVAYLIANGTQPSDPHYNYHIRGLRDQDPNAQRPLIKVERLYYNTLDTGLTTTAQFLDVRNAMHAVCSLLSQDEFSGFTWNDCVQVRNAWASVGVGDPYPYTKLFGYVYDPFLLNLNTPYFAVGDVTIPSSSQLAVEPQVDLYFFPNTKIKAEGSVEADGSSGTIKLLSSRGNHGMKLDARLRVRNGGEIKLPVNTYESTDTRPNPIILIDASVNTISSFIRIDEDFTITDVNVTLDITHTWDSDLQVTLFSPNGTSVVLFRWVGNGGSDFYNTTLDDEADTDIGAGSAPFTGSFRPQNPLTAFDAQNARGYWELQVMDPFGGNTGTLRSWSLRFQR